MKAKKLPGSIFIDIREWRDRTYGNTYYSAIVTVDGVWQFTTGMKYGYGHQAVNECVDELIARGVLSPIPAHESRTYALRNLGVNLYVGRRDVLKRELPKAASSEAE